MESGTPEQPATVINISPVDGIRRCYNDTPSYVAASA